ncbi:MAG: T9SS type A sorting domain-containing protein [Bacteroidales bacterium]|nr:T9SS type A sorting domain-containing protein [Bacteroidales bacterium]
MRSLPLFLAVFFLSIAGKSQSPSDCDSVFINCCPPGGITSEAITIEAANHASYIFPYPGFILFDANNDTIAKEAVNYFGIGYFYQAHMLELKAPFSLPFDGYLELHTGFYNEMACTFPFHIPDTTLTNLAVHTPGEVTISPNPAVNLINIFFTDRFDRGAYTIKILNTSGQIVYKTKNSEKNLQIQSGQIGLPGIYFLTVKNSDNYLVANKKIILR